MSFRGAAADTKKTEQPVLPLVKPTVSFDDVRMTDASALPTIRKQPSRSNSSSSSSSRRRRNRLLGLGGCLAPPPISAQSSTGSSAEEPKPPSHVFLGSPARIRREASNVARAVVSAFGEMGARAIAKRDGGDAKTIRQSEKAGRSTKTMDNALNDLTPEQMEAQENARLVAMSRP